MRYALTDDEWIAIKPMLPNKPRGVPRVNDRRAPPNRPLTLRNDLQQQKLSRSFSAISGGAIRRQQQRITQFTISSRIIGRHGSSKLPPSGRKRSLTRQI
jgi:transposase